MKRARGRASYVAAALVVVGLLAAVSQPSSAARDRGLAGSLVKTAFNQAIGKTILVDARGRTLYLFQSDYGGKSTCLKMFDCSKSWPPLVTRGKPRAAGRVRASKLGTTKRPDGRIQVTYYRHPLYFYAGGVGRPRDLKPGDAHGQGILQLWWVVSLAGKAIRTPCKTETCD